MTAAFNPFFEKGPHRGLENGEPVWALSSSSKQKLPSARPFASPTIKRSACSSTIHGRREATDV